MKVLVVLCAVAACCVASPSVSYAYSSLAPLGYPYGYAAGAPLAYASAAYAAPSQIAYAAAPAPVAYAAAPAPVAYAAAPAPVAYAAAPAPVAVAAGVKSQYHSQDELGQAAYGHAEPGQTHNAVQDANGNKVGSFSYVAPNGNVFRTDYVADSQGYRVASNALPIAPVRRRRSIAVQTPASTQPLAVAAPVAYAPAPVAYAAAPAPLAYAAAPAQYAYAAAPAQYAYSAPAQYAYAAAPAPVAYAASPLAYSAPLRQATLTTIVNNPGHAVSYRVD